MIENECQSHQQTEYESFMLSNRHGCFRMLATIVLVAWVWGWERNGAAAASSDLVPLDIKLPAPAYIGTPPNLKLGDRVEALSDKARPPFLAPKGCTNVAFKKKVTSSDKSPTLGNLELVTDGDKEATDESYVELHRKVQWVQIDLGGAHTIHAILVWHVHSVAQVFHSVVVQLADDPDFTQNVRTVFNNDMENEAGLGTGTQKEYIESHEGKLIPVKGEQARYVRLYSNGSTANRLNRYTEVEVYGLRAQ
jgi:hypothetical protein